MDTPRKTKLYNKLAKDYQPKQAAMMICRYLEEQDARIAALEKEIEAFKTSAEKSEEN